MGYKRERFINLARLMLHTYMTKSRTDKQFTAYLKKSVGPSKLTQNESDALVKHFAKEIYPVDKDTISWMMKNLNSKEIKFCTKLKQIKKLLK